MRGPTRTGAQGPDGTSFDEWQLNMMKPSMILLLAMIGFGACASDSGPSKDDIQHGGKGDGVDYCQVYGWYCDGECDTFCMNPDPDCNLPNFCASALCGPGTRCDEARDRCVTDAPNFCASALCGPGTVCDESRDACVDDGFCTRALCGPGTRCDE